MDFRAIKAELTNNAAAYNGMTDAQIASALQAKPVNGTPQPLVVASTVILNAIAPADLQALTATQLSQLTAVLGMGTVDASPGTNARALLLAIFSGKSTTLTALAALAAKYDTPTLPFARDATETITAAHVAAARSIAWTASVTSKAADPSNGNITAIITYRNSTTNATQTQSIPGNDLTDARLAAIAQTVINVLVARDLAISQLTLNSTIT